ncbi:MAG: bifunctional phosphoglucose/phosphomannose isomerase [Anaerolineales bacterium]|nr:bifunctional phosphoglucose/phosphomannose isomerase [Anaerolineae bacterium]PWB49463.1 MAG: bifunctional phosphoglucose/phosphomannose isomerase [Anaerolineales bacterium]
MDLNNHTLFKKIDSQNYLVEINHLPDQLDEAYQLGLQAELPAWQGIKNVLIAGMGGSAIGADLLIAYAAPICPVPVSLLRNYNLPAWAHGPGTLVVASSHSGNTEETLQAFDQAQQRGCRILAVCTGGKLDEKARQANLPSWIFQHAGQPRAAVGYSFGLLLALLARLGLISDPVVELKATITAMRILQNEVRADIPVASNPAKREAGQLMGRLVLVFGADVLEPVARRWKTQINELAKSWAQFEAVPEADHNALAGLSQPESLLSTSMALFLRAQSYHPHNLLRTELTKQAYMLEGLNTDFIDAQGESPLTQQWTALLFGDYMAYYLAMLYEIDPTPITMLEGFKHKLAGL